MHLSTKLQTPGTDVLKCTSQMKSHLKQSFLQLNWSAKTHQLSPWELVNPEVFSADKHQNAEVKAHGCAILKAEDEFSRQSDPDQALFFKSAIYTLTLCSNEIKGSSDGSRRSGNAHSLSSDSYPSRSSARWSPADTRRCSETRTSRRSDSVRHRGLKVKERARRGQGRETSHQRVRCQMVLVSPLQVVPLPVYPGLHEQLWPPTVLKHRAFSSQLCCPDAHSSCSGERENIVNKHHESW